MDIITLIMGLVTGLLDAEENFLRHLDTFPEFEENVHGLGSLTLSFKHHIIKILYLSRLWLI